MQSEEPITDYAKLDLNGVYSYADYLRWQFKERVELIKGKVFKMSPAPNTNHQVILADLSREFLGAFQNHGCKVFFAPFDVRLPIAKPGKDYTVVQPDLCVIRDVSKLDRLGCNGAPDLVVEILSPGNSAHEMRTKFNLYEEAGIKEYWIIEPDKKVVLVYFLSEAGYIGSRPFVDDQVIVSPLFPELKIIANDLFKNMIS